MNHVCDILTIIKNFFLLKNICTIQHLIGKKLTYSEQVPKVKFVFAMRMRAWAAILGCMHASLMVCSVLAVL